MRTFSTKLMTAVTLAAVGVVASSAMAGNNKGGGSKGGNFGGVGIRLGSSGVGVSFGNGGNHHHHNSGNYHKKYNNYGNYGQCNSYGGGYSGGGYPIGGYPNVGYYGQACEPFHYMYVCQPGESFYTVSLKEYGTSVVANHIARFNGMLPNAALVPGQRLMLPSVSANGTLTQSRAPAPSIDATAPTTTPNPTAKLTQPTTSVESILASNVTVMPSEPLPSVTVGSTLMLDGQMFGDERGTARLRVGGMTLKVEVLEWTGNSAKVRLPRLELDSAAMAEIEVLRADGSLASQTGIELTPATARLALGN